MAQDSTLVATTAIDDEERFEAVTSEASSDENDDIAEARARIEQARSDMSGTIDAIKDRLSPAHLVEEAKEATVDKVKAVASEAVETVKEKATAVAELIQEKAAPVVEAVQEKATQAMDAARSTAQTISAKVSEFTSSHAHSNDSVPVYRNSGSFGETLMDTIKANPLPAAIAGFGLGWLLVSMQRQRSTSMPNYQGRLNFDGADFDPEAMTPSRVAAQRFEIARNSTSLDNGSGLRERAADMAQGVAEKASDIAHGVSDKASGFAQTVSSKASDAASSVSARADEWKGRATEMAGGVRDKASDIAQGVSGKASDLADASKVQYKAATDGLDRFIDEQPLAAGAIALLIGAAVGVLVPSTMKENQWFGPKRDELFDQASGAVQDAARKAQNVAEVALGQARDGLGQTLNQAKHQIQQTVDQTKETVKTEAQNQGLTTAAA